MITDKHKYAPVVKYTRWIIANRWLVIGLSLMSAILLGFGAKNLSFSNDYRVFFSKDNPQLQAFEEVENLYNKNDNIVFVLKPKSGQVFTSQFLEAVTYLTTEAWQIPNSTRVDSITNFQHTRAEGDDLYVDNLVTDPQRLSVEQLDQIKRIAINEPLLLNRLITKKADVTGINVSIQLPPDSTDEVIKVTNFARDLEAKFKSKYPNIDTYISGVVAMNNAFSEYGQKDAFTLTPTMYVLMLIVMVFILKSFNSTLSALTVIILSTVAAMGAAGHLGLKLTPPSAIAPTVILTLAIADSIHILISMLLLIRDGWPKIESLCESMRINMQAVLLTSLTTVVGFLCLNFSDSPPYRDLGNITAIGVVLAFVYSITTLPAVISLLPIRPSQKVGPSTSAMSRFAEFVIFHYKKILVSTSLLFVLLATFIPFITLNDQFIRWFDPKVDFRQDTEFMLNNLTGIYTFEYSIDSGKQEGISQPEFMSKIENFANWWRGRPETMHVLTYTDIMKKLNKTMHRDSQDWYKLPSNEELAAQYLLLYEMSLPYGLDLNNQLDINKSSVRLTVTLEEMTSAHARYLSALGDQWLRDNTPQQMHAHATGPSVMFSHISLRNINSMFKGTLFALLLITILMGLTLRSWKYGLISLLPNAIPIIMAFGLWSILYNEVGMAISIVASATLGIIVDDSVHFLTKFLRAKRENNSSTEDAIRYAFSNVGLALIVTSVILIIGFSVMLFSSFLLNWTLGALSAITITLALFVDFFFLPSLLIFLDKLKNA